MEEFILDDIKFHFDFGDLDSISDVGERATDKPQINKLINEAYSIARPRAGYKVALINDRGKNFVVIDEVRFDSRVLAVNFEGVQRVFPYLATSGREIESWADSQNNILDRFWACRICELVLRSAVAALIADIKVRFENGKTAEVNPGSTIDWPLKGQFGLFQILGSVHERIGVKLRDNLWMDPIMSTSGIRYATEGSYKNCSLCPREDCRLRKAPYDNGLYKREYQKT